MEIILLGASLAIYSTEHREPRSGRQDDGPLRKGVTKWEALEILFDLLRIILLAGLIFFYLLFVLLRWTKLKGQRRAKSGHLPETQSLLETHQAENGHINGQAYGSTVADPAKEETSGWVRPTTIPSKSWWEYIRGYSLFFPYLWPSKSAQLQITFVICFILLVLARVVNVLVPLQAGHITNILSDEENAPRGVPWSWEMVPWGQICLYILYRFLQGTNGIIGATRATLWVPISQYSYQELSTASFEHVHGLSLDFHLGKKTGEVLSALSKGNSINTFLEQVTFSVFPMLIDLAVAIGYFLIKFDAYYALVVAVVTFLYLYLTIRLAQWRAEIRREMVNFSRQEDAVK